FLQHTDLRWNGRPERVAETRQEIARLRAEGAPWYARWSLQRYFAVLLRQIAVVTWLDPEALRHHLTFPVSGESTRTCREYNRGPMRLSACVLTAPHAYVMSLCAMFDRLDVYLWLRVFVANALFVSACIWQRSATRRTQRALRAAGILPLQVES